MGADMTFYRSQKTNAAAVYNRHNGLFLGMIRQVALSESATDRISRETLSASTSDEMLELIFDLRWHSAPDFQHQPLQYAMKQVVPDALSTLFTKLATTHELQSTQDNEHVLVKCDPWFVPQPTLELALKKTSGKVA